MREHSIFIFPLNSYIEPEKKHEGTVKQVKKKSNAAFSDARKAVIDRMATTTKVVKVSSSLGFNK